MDVESSTPFLEMRNAEEDQKRNRNKNILLGVLLIIIIVLIALVVVFASRARTEKRRADGLSKTAASSSSSTGSPTSNSTSNSTSSPTSSTSSSTGGPTTPRPSASPTPKVCQTPECYRLAGAILSSLDRTANPCDNFDTFVCGNYKEKNEWQFAYRPRGGTIIDLFTTDDRIVMDALFGNDSVIHQSKAAMKALNFWVACASQQNTGLEVSSKMLAHSYDSILMFNVRNHTYNWTQANKKGLSIALADLTIRDWNPIFKQPPSGMGQTTLSGRQNLKSLTNADVQAFIAPYRVVLEDLQRTADPNGSVREYWDGFTQFMFQIRDYQKNALQVPFSSYLEAPSFFVSNFTLNVINLLEIQNEMFYNYTNTSQRRGGRPKTFGNELIGTMGSDIEYINKVDNLLTNSTINGKNYGPDFARSWLYIGLRNELSLSNFFLTTIPEKTGDKCFSFVKQYFPFVYGYILAHTSYQNYDAASVLTEYTQDVLQYGIRNVMENSVWMSNASKAAAIKKVENMRLFIGFPNQTLNATAVDEFYSGLKIEGYSWIAMVTTLVDEFVRSRREIFAPQSVSTYTPPVDPWPTIFRNPQYFGAWLTGVNAFYVRSGNFFTIPVTISQKLFFSTKYPSTVNFGGLGAIIGHEISHGFDPSGNQYDYKGTYTPPSIFDQATLDIYKNHTDCYVKAYDKIFLGPSDGFTNGTRTLAENVADNSGLVSSYLAWKKYSSSRANEKLPGLENWSDDQLFFAAYARLWCSVSVPGVYQDWMDVHAPPHARIVGAIMNNPYFGKAWSCPAGSPMNPKKKCALWWGQ